MFASWTALGIFSNIVNLTDLELFWRSDKREVCQMAAREEVVLAGGLEVELNYGQQMVHHRKFLQELRGRHCLRTWVGAKNGNG